MSLIAWILTIAFGFGGLGLWIDGGFVGAKTSSVVLCVIALLACPFLWARPGGLVPDELAPAAKVRLMLVLALVLATPLMLPWQLWL